MCVFLLTIGCRRRDVGPDQIKSIRWSDYKNPFTDLLFLDTYIDMDKYNKLPRVLCVPMRSVLAELGVTHVDIWVLDTEVRIKIEADNIIQRSFKRIYSFHLYYVRLQYIYKYKSF